MVIWAFKEDSALNKTWVRVLNAIILVPFFILMASTDVVTIRITPLAMIYIVTSVGLSISYTLSKTKWFEVDKKESKRKELFIITYCCIAMVYAFIIANLFTSSITLRTDGGQIYINVALIAYFVFNKINICSLLNFGDFFTNMLSLYVNSPCELTRTELLEKEKDMIKYVLRKDHFIDLDEIIFELQRYKGF